MWTWKNRTEMGLVQSIEKWGTSSMSSGEIKKLRSIFGDRADELLRYYDF